MRRFTVPCNFGDVKSPFYIYIGADYDRNKHPLHYQAGWLTQERGGTIPEEVMESMQKLGNIAIENNVNFEELVSYALGAAQEEESGKKKKPSAASRKKEQKPQSSGKKSEKEISPVRNYAKTSLSVESDLIAFKNREKNIEFLHGLARHIVTENFALQSLARNTLLAYLIYVCDLASQRPSIENIYQKISAGDVVYNIAVNLDTFGGALPAFVTGSFEFFLHSSKVDRSDALTHLFCRMHDFAFDKISANSPYKNIQQALKKHILSQKYPNATLKTKALKTA